MDDSEKLQQLKDSLGAEIGGSMYLIGKPTVYYCEDHGDIVSAQVFDPQASPEYICPECHERLSSRRLDR